MPKTYVPRPLRAAVERTAGYRCGYCLTPQGISGAAMEIDHIIPEASGGLTVEDNLWLACASCNRYKGSRAVGRDPIDGEPAPLFNPRQQRWRDHFSWSEDGVEIVGLTACGRATVSLLRMNHPQIVGARSLWVHSGWWPPEEQEPP